MSSKAVSGLLEVTESSARRGLEGSRQTTYLARPRRTSLPNPKMKSVSDSRNMTNVRNIYFPLAFTYFIV